MVKLKGDGQSAQDVRVEFTAVNCSGQFRIVVEAVTRPAVDLGGGAFQATIEKDTRGLSVGDRTILITGAGASTTVGLKVT